MFIKVATTSLGVATCLGGGFAIFLFHNQSNSQEEPDKKKKTKKPIVKKAVTNSTYSRDKGPNKSDYYFLTKMDKNLMSEDLKNVKTMDFTIRNPDDSINLQVFDDNTIDLPFYCFEGDNVDSVAELDLVNLKKCKDIKSTIENKFVVIYYGSLKGVDTKTEGGKFAVLNSNKPTFEYFLQTDVGDIFRNTGEIISVFLDDFFPTEITEKT